MTVLNVQDYGAQGDGVTDDSSAIQAAIDDTSAGDTVYIPETSASYLVTSSGRGAIEVNGNHPGNLTIRGDGVGSYLRMGDISYDTYAWVIGIDTDSGPVTGLTVEHLRLSGNKSDNPAGSGSGGSFGIHAYPPSTGCDVTYRHLLVEDCGGDGINSYVSETTIERCTARGNEGHGIAVADTAFPDGDYGILVRDSKSVNNGFGTSRWGGNGLNVEGNCRIVNAYTEGNRHGNKTSDVAVGQSGAYTEQWWEQIHSVNEQFEGYYQSLADTDDATIHLDDYQVVNASRNGFRPATGGNVTYDVGEILATGCDNGLRPADDVQIDCDVVRVYDNVNYGIYWGTTETGSVGTEYHSGNSTAVGDPNGTLTIGTQTQHAATTLDAVPGPDDVGAWSTTQSDSGGQDTTQETFQEWTPRWASSTDDWSIVSGSEFEGGHALRFDQGGTGASRNALSWATVGEPSDVEVLDKFRVPSFTADSNLGFHARVHLRSSTTNGNEEGYWVEASAPHAAFRLGKYTADGGLTTLGTFGTPVENTFYYRRFRAEGDQLKAKVWPVGEAEPAAWDIEVTDTDHTAGWVGLGSYNAEPVETDVFSVATNGDTAQLSPDGTPTVSWANPTDGATVSGTEIIKVDAADDEDQVGSLTVEYRLDDGTWQATSYNSKTGYYEARWDSTGMQDGEYTLEARASNSLSQTANATIGVTVQNSVGIETRRVEEVTDSSARLVGALTDLGGASEVTGSFEWRELGTDSWTVVGEQSLTSTGEFDAQVTGLASGTAYEFRTVVTDGTTTAADPVTFETSADAGNGLSIEQFDVTDKSNPAWSRFDVDWTVADANGTLDTVITELRYNGTTVDSESTEVDGDRASFSHVVRVKGNVDEVRLSVKDTANQSVSESQDV